MFEYHLSACLVISFLVSVEASFTPDVVPLNLLFWRGDTQNSSQDNYVTTKAVHEVNEFPSWEYLFVRREGYVYDSPVPGRGTIPLFVYYNSNSRDHVLANADFNMSGYIKLYPAGYAYGTENPPKGITTPLYMYFSAKEQDHFSCATKMGVQQAEAAGYKNQGIIAYILTSEPTSQFVRITQDMNGIWWLTQRGQLFMSIGVNHVNNGGMDDGVGGRESSLCQQQYPNCGDTLSYAPAAKLSPYYHSVMARYGTEVAWAENTGNRLRKWYFNTASGWSATIVEKLSGLLYCHLLDIGTTWNDHGKMGDVFGEEMKQQMLSIAEKEVLPRFNDTNLIGWQLDNEFDLNQDFLEEYLSMNSTAAGQKRAIQFLQERYPSVEALDKAWNVQATSYDDARNHLHDKTLNATQYSIDRNAFLYVFCLQYFNLSYTAIRKYDSNHLILGMRFGSSNEQAILAGVPFVDWIDQHMYSDLPDVSALYQIHQITGKPVIVGEFSFTASDSNLPNSKGARSNHPYLNQTERAAAFHKFATLLASQPHVVGYHWWQWADEPATGRWPDGEDSNYGLVHIDDDEYDLLTAEMTKTNAFIQDIHANSTKFFT
eukprot:m.310668 g.310668  ORF g.310668 m.310668 type:complete len:600 (+) comp53629_c0_seq1:60-1859(+)